MDDITITFTRSSDGDVLVNLFTSNLEDFCTEPLAPIDSFVCTSTFHTALAWAFDIAKHLYDSNSRT